MERQKYLLISLLLMIVTMVQASCKQKIFEAYVKSDMQSWKLIIDSLENTTSLDKEEQLELLNYQYGYIGWCIGNKRKKEAEQYLKKAEHTVESMLKADYLPSLMYAYKAAFIGFRIGISPYKAPFIGFDSVTFVDKALELDADNAFAYEQKGNIQYYMPSVFGGSKTEALKYYERALELFEQDSLKVKEDWNYLNILGILIQANIACDNHEKADTYCSKALAVAPEFVWVKKELFPELEAKRDNHSK